MCAHCNGYDADVTVKHALSCKARGLVSLCHNNVRDEVGALAAMVI